ncbi:MAG TPA: SGNH/GDSL hydrolase family protein [Mycobacterium sp.]|jgi:lysophospholipase L1-like esterase|nr:SGNH/GDSL hydrolase family protein [Mycobacterium sp.]
MRLCQRTSPAPFGCRLAVAALAAIVTVVGFLVTSAGARAGVRYPNSIAGLGDSITRAADVCCWYGDHPGQSWSTGGAGWDGVASHYERLSVLHPKIAGHNYNDAVSGAKARDLPGQAAKAVGQGAQYVTVLIGANDLCTSSVSTMTSVADFTASVQSALTTLRQGLPNARIFVSSIPNIYQLWSVLHTNLFAQAVWAVAGICQSMLSSSTTDTQRRQVVARELAFNTVLADACQSVANCRWDNNATYNYKFAASQISTLDYFHPSLSGQAALASVTWNASWWA